MDSERLFVTVECEGRRLDAALPSEVALADLVPQLLEMLGLPPDVAGWRLAGPSGDVLRGNLTLAQSGVEEGSEVRLVNSDTGGWSGPPVIEPELSPEVAPLAAAAQAPQPAPPPAAGRRVTLPESPPLARRVRAVAQAVVAQDRIPEPVPEGVEPAGLSGRDRLTVKRPRSPFERAEAVWRAGDYRHQLDQAIRAPRLTSAVTIAVVSPKGGVGKTTTSALLGMLLAKVRSDRVVAIDSNPDYGTLGRILTPEHEIFVDDLLGVLHQPALTVTMLEHCLGQAPHGLLVLPAPTDPGRMERLDAESYERVIRRLQELAGIVLLDCGAGLQDPITRVAMATADQLVLVSDADPVTAGLVAEAGLRLPDATSFTYVVNKLPRTGSRLNLEQLAADLPAARGMIQIQADSTTAARLSDGRFNWEEAPAAWQVAYRELAAVLAADWASLGLAA